LVCGSCSLDGQDGGQPTAYFEDTDVVEATRTVRESAERAAAAALSATSATTTALAGNGNTGPCMYRPETHRLAAENDKVQPPEIETTPEPETGQLENRSVELADDSILAASATLARITGKEELCRPPAEITSSATQPEIVTRRPVAAVDRKSACQEPTSERFDRVVQYYDSRQHISGRPIVGRFYSFTR